MSTPEPAPEVELEVRIKLRGSLATIAEIADLTSELDVFMTERYPEQYRGASIKLDADMAGPMPSAADRAWAGQELRRAPWAKQDPEGPAGIGGPRGGRFASSPPSQRVPPDEPGQRGPEGMGPS